jgi:type VI secretion system protein ImpJ
MVQRHLERVVWTEGMLMCPQHLQQQDLFFEATLSARLGSVASEDWGVVSMKVDEGELSSGQFKISEFRGVLSRGLPIEWSAGDATAPPARPIAEHFSSTATTLEVFLAVPAAREGIPNYQEALDDSQAARYRVMNRPVPDLTIAKTEHIIGFGRPNAVFLFGHESREDYETVKVAEVTRDATGQYQLSTTYIPPALRVGGSKVLRDGLQSLLSVMLGKQRSLAQTRRQVDAAAVEFTSQDITRYLLLSALSSYIPVVRHVVEYPGASAMQGYLACIQLGGALTAFTGDVDPAAFPQFVHNDLRSTFEPLLATLAKMLGATVRERTVDVPLEARQDGMWIGQLKDDRLPKCPRFVLAVEAQADQQETANRLPKLSKIASWKQINQIVRSATPGVPLTVTHRPPPEVPVRPKIVYFMLDTADAYFRTISTERTVAIYLPPPFDPSKATITLMGIPERGTDA